MSDHTILRFKTEELDAFLKDPNSQVRLQKDVKHHMLLTPVCLSDPHAAILDILNADLMKFFPKFKGILLSYKHVRMLGSTGNIYDDNCHIHINLLVDFYIFTPSVGCILKGIVSKKSPYNIGLLVHKGFNVAIPIPEHETSDETAASSIQIGEEIKFEVEILNFRGKLPYIRGKLVTGDGTTSLKKRKKSKSKNEDLELPLSESEEYSTKSQKKRKRKHSEGPNHQDMDSAGTKYVSSDSGVSSPTVERKKNYYNENTDQEKIDKNVDDEVNTSLITDSYKKKHKKSKFLDGEEISNSFNNIKVTSEVDGKMQVQFEKINSSKISEMSEDPHQSKRKKEKHVSDKIGQMLQTRIESSFIENCTSSLRDKTSDSSIEKKRKKHMSKVKEVSPLKEKKRKKKSEVNGEF